MTPTVQNQILLYRVGVDRGSVQNATIDLTLNPDHDDTLNLDQNLALDLDPDKEDRNNCTTNFDPAMEHAGSVQQKNRTARPNKFQSKLYYSHTRD